MAGYPQQPALILIGCSEEKLTWEKTINLSSPLGRFPVFASGNWVTGGGIVSPAGVLQSSTAKAMSLCNSPRKEGKKWKK